MSKKVKTLILKENYKGFKAGDQFEEYIFEKNAIVVSSGFSGWYEFDFFTDPELTVKEKQEGKKRKTFKDRFEKGKDKPLEECNYYIQKILPLRNEIKALEKKLNEKKDMLKEVEKFNS